MKRRHYQPDSATEARALKNIDRDYILRQREWSTNTFGPGMRTEGILEHIEKELKEIRETPWEVMEWVDVIILALDGAWRAGWTAEEIIATMHDKQVINFARTWPSWEGNDGRAIERIREEA